MTNTSMNNYSSETEEEEQSEDDILSNVKLKTIGFLKKYFFEGIHLILPGQALSESYKTQLKIISVSNLPWYQRIMITHRRFIGMLLPAVFFHFFWWTYFINFNTWYLFKANYPISIMMIFGSIIAGMTSEGGGSVAFPVMTLAFNIKTSIARDFTLMIQSFGMVAASFTIFFMKIHLEWRSIIFCTLGGVFGNIFGIGVLDKYITPPQKKIGFVSLFFTFAFVLFLLNRIHDRKINTSIPEFNWWKATILVFTGFFGGIFTGLTGGGIDICSFSILTLFFRVSEKTATPTSVVLMAINTVIGSYWRIVMIGTVDKAAWEYVGVSLPIVVIGAPVGAVIGSNFHRLALAVLVYITNTTALITGYAILHLNKTLISISVSIIVIGFVFFGIITWLGGRMMERITKKEITEHKILETLEMSISSQSTTERTLLLSDCTL